ncbi:hypothetical protein [Phaffia rhodozyma]|uniref:Uncharacterized protein n=1 Tax=Phaffia rhodozyma TaxID=264483 RepID=A0A0F7SNP8_PHARH|nr:hypothetical protein [Phaffia rhodozyma]
MPQPNFVLSSYLGEFLPSATSSPLPTLQGSPPLGVGGKSPRPDWPDGLLQSLVKIKDFKEMVDKYFKEQVPTNSLPTHPGHLFPHLQSLSRTMSLSPDASLLKALKTLPLDAVVAAISAWNLSNDPETSAKVSSSLEADAHPLEELGEVKIDGAEVGTVSGLKDSVAWKYGKSPMGETEFILVDSRADVPALVVRALTIPFEQEDFDEFSVTGTYRYNPKSKASWLWSRQSLGTKRLGIKHFVLTNYNNWVFGVFNEDHTFAAVSPVISASAEDPSVLQALTYWSQSALGAEGGFKIGAKPQASLSDQVLFPTNPARRASMNKGKERVRPEKRLDPKIASESDVEDDDA